MEVDIRLPNMFVFQQTHIKAWAATAGGNRDSTTLDEATAVEVYRKVIGASVESEFVRARLRIVLLESP